MDGRIDGRTDRPADGRIDGRTVGQTDGRLDGRLDGRMDGRTVGPRGERMDGRREDRQTNVHANGRTNKPAVRRMDVPKKDVRKDGGQRRTDNFFENVLCIAKIIRRNDLFRFQLEQSLQKVKFAVSTIIAGTEPNSIGSPTIGKEDFKIK